MQQLITSTYEHKLARAFFDIDNRGLLMNQEKLGKLRLLCNDSVKNLCSSVSKATGEKIYVGAENKPATKDKSYNINYSPNLQTLLKNLGFSLPKIRVKNEHHEYEMKDSANKLVLQKVLADPTLWPPGFFEAKKLIADLLELHKIIKVKNTYVNARLYNNVMYSCYGVASTITGRRNSKRHPYNLGGNSQNYPKYTDIGRQYQECIMARPKRIFFRVDQKGAEDWPVQALAQNYQALEELRNGINRHVKLASYIFSIPESVLQLGRAAHDPTAEFQYYLGKKSRHANNYGLRAQRFSEQLAENGYSVPKDTCAEMLRKVAEIDPNVHNVFHAYIRDEIFNKKMLVTPFGRERQVFGLRPNEHNWDILNECYSYIPQSTVGDNTGLAILYIYTICNGSDTILHDGHDSIVQEPLDTEQSLLDTFYNTTNSFNRDITFHNGITIKIPVEGELGYDWNNFEKLKEFTPDCLIETYRKLKQKIKDQEPITMTEGSLANAAPSQEVVAGELS